MEKYLLDRWRKVTAEASAGPWNFHVKPPPRDAAKGLGTWLSREPTPDEKDASFINEAREAMPVLLAEFDRLTALVDEYRRRVQIVDAQTEKEAAVGRYAMLTAGKNLG